MSLFFHRSATTTKSKSVIKSGIHPTLHKDTVSVLPVDVAAPPPVSSSRSSPRIPVALQQVFLQSNRGEEVHVPPSKNMASRIFRTLTFRGRRNTNPKRNRNDARKNHPISSQTTTTTLDHTTTNSSSSRSSDRYDDPTFIVEVNTSTSSTTSSTSTSCDTNRNHHHNMESPPAATAGTTKHTTNRSTSSKQYEDIVVVHPTTTIQKEVSLTVT